MAWRGLNSWSDPQARCPWLLSSCGGPSLCHPGRPCCNDMKFLDILKRGHFFLCCSEKSFCVQEKTTEAKLTLVSELLTLILNLATAVAKHFSKCRALWAPKIREGVRFVRLPCNPAPLYGTSGICWPFPAPGQPHKGSSVLGYKFFHRGCLQLPERLPLALRSCPAFWCGFSE